MSRALAVKDRLDRDAYYTPDALAAACVAALALPSKSWVLEPHAGGGAYVRALKAAGMVTLARDIHPEAPGLAAADSGLAGDFLELQATDATVIVGNPPYRFAEEHIRHALSLVPRVAFLLRAGILGSRTRAPLWEEHPPARIWMVQGRPSFTGGGTDSAEYVLLDWDEGHRGEPVFRWLSWSGENAGVRALKEAREAGQMSLLLGGT